MPFAVFRRHQRKLIAVFGILAMFAFVVADSLPRLLNGSQSGGGNPEVVKLYGRSIRRSDLNRMATERIDANQFFAEFSMMMGRGQMVSNYFGPTNTEGLIDALILEHEADRLGMPTSPIIGRDWLKKQPFSSILTTQLFEIILRRYNNRISGEQLLGAISNQVRINNVQQLLGRPVITPLEIYGTYRDQNEKVSTRSVGFRTDEYLKDVTEPKASEVETYYDKYKDVLPDPDSPTPGFKIPRRIKLEILSIDGEALARSIRDKLTEAELLEYYEAHKTEFKMPNPFPDDIFKGDPKGDTPLPPVVRPFTEVRVYIAPPLADDKMKAEINSRFSKFTDMMGDFANAYADVLDENAEAKQAGKPEKPLPTPEVLRDLAKASGLEHEITPLLSQEQADHYGIISTSAVGMERFSDGRKFIEEVFDAKPRLFEPTVLSDASGRRFLIRKLDDQAPRVPSFKEVETDVVLAWKSEHARPFAEKAAQAFAETLKKGGGKIEGEIVEGHPVLTTDLVSKLQPSMLPGQLFANGPATPSDIPQMPHAGPTLRDAYFGLQASEVAVAPDEPKKVYYVMTLKDRIPASFDVLYGLSGEYQRYESETLYSAFQKQNTEWMNALRKEAGLPPGWTYKDDSKSG